MILIVVVVFSLFMVIGYTLIAKLACRLMSRTQLAWKHCIAYSVVVNAAGLAISRLIPIDGSVAKVVLSFAVVVAVSLSFGSWYFKGRATNASGEGYGWGNAFKLALLIQLLLPVLGLVFFGLTQGFSSLKKPL